MTTREILDLIRLLSAIQACTLQKEPMPDYLYEHLATSLDVLERCILEETLG